MGTQLRISLVAGMLLVGACSGGDDGAGAGSAAARGSAVCQDWQAAACDFLVRCAGMDRADCEDDYHSITCKDDGAASNCAKAFRAAADCSTVPPNCQASDIADRTVAAAACNRFIDATCAAEGRCGLDEAACKTSAADRIDCSQAVGSSPSLDTCVKEFETLACTATMGPASCKGAIKVASTSATAPASACGDFRNAVCDRAIQCGLQDSASSCQFIATLLSCSSDAAATDCAGTVANTACGAAVPDSCREGLTDIAGVQAACTKLNTAVCAFQTRCGDGGAVCATPPVDCTKVVVADIDSIDQCAVDLQTYGCTEVGLPVSCTGRVSQTFPSVLF
jgi:hypothetical protein